MFFCCCVFGGLFQLNVTHFFTTQTIHNTLRIGDKALTNNLIKERK